MYADDIAPICEDLSDVQLALSIMHKECLWWGLKVIASKSEVLADREVISSTDHALAIFLGYKCH